MSSEHDDELKQALAAAFGDEAAELLDDNLDDLSDEELAAMFGADGLQSPVTPLRSTGTDSPRVQWMAELCKSLYASQDATSQSTSGQQDLSRFVVFQVADQRFGISINEVREVARCPKITALPCTPPWLRGVANFRSQVFSVTDLRTLLRVTGGRPQIGEKSWSWSVGINSRQPQSLLIKLSVFESWKYSLSPHAR